LINHPKQTAKKTAHDMQGKISSRQTVSSPISLSLPFRTISRSHSRSALATKPCTCLCRLETTHSAVESSPATLGEIQFPLDEDGFLEKACAYTASGQLPKSGTRPHLQEPLTIIANAIGSAHSRELAFVLSVVLSRQLPV
jgi:hypothetical protein